MDLSQLDALAAWMRKTGATRVRVSGVAMELELGPDPSGTIDLAAVEETHEERRERALEQLRQHLDVTYAHIGGWRGTDEELERMLDAGGV